MSPEEWQKSIAMTFGVRAEWNAREVLLKGCDIQRSCWVFPRKMMYLGRLRFPVQRVAFAMFKGPLVETAEVVASCGNAQCCCPAHLTAVSRETRVKA